MKKTKEELTVPKEDIKTISKQLYEFNDEELAIVSGGYDIDYRLIRCVKIIQIKEEEINYYE